VFIDGLPDVCKIGKCKNGTERVIGGQTWIPAKLRIFATLVLPNTESAYNWEQKIHRFLADYRVYSNSEWFKLNRNQIVEFIQNSPYVDGLQLDWRIFDDAGHYGFLPMDTQD